MKIIIEIDDEEVDQILDVLHNEEGRRKITRKEVEEILTELIQMNFISFDEERMEGVINIILEEGMEEDENDWRGV